ncbi:MAG TPA: GNAT family N-acetyltransferase [Lactobacillus sp.]|nr:GNAT family N-acetyltransferase [Lactobacillus sp.]
MKAITIEKLTNISTSQLDQIMHIWLQENISAHGAYVSEAYWRTNEPLVRQLIQTTATVYVAEEHGVVKGFCGLQDDYIAGIFVCSDMHGQGVGTRLIEAVKADHHRLSLSVYKQNSVAIKFYETQGFVLTQTGMDEENHVPECEMNWEQTKF